MDDHDTKRLDDAVAKAHASIGKITDALGPQKDQARLDRDYVGKRPPFDDEEKAPQD